MPSDRPDQQEGDALTWGAIRQQCPMCETFKASIDFTRNPRFGILCRPCMDKLLKIRQEPRHRQNQRDETPRVRGDGQPVGSPPPEMI
jgi:hypothetical protein